MCSGFTASADAGDDVIIDAIFHIGRAVLVAIQSLYVGFVLREQQLRTTFTMQPTPPGW